MTRKDREEMACEIRDQFMYLTKGWTNRMSQAAYVDMLVALEKALVMVLAYFPDDDGDDDE